MGQAGVNLVEMSVWGEDILPCSTVRAAFSPVQDAPPVQGAGTLPQLAAGAAAPPFKGDLKRGFVYRRVLLINNHYGDEVLQVYES
jgi:hypothetical protein